MVRTYPRFPENLLRYVFGWGGYPYICAVRTPVGTVAPILYSKFDMLTVNEIFCREDYAADELLRVAVDIGANVGLAALYFLTRNSYSFVYCYEPVPQNIDRLRENLADMEGRFAVDHVAISTSAGPASFATEDSGRYGKLAADGDLRVHCREINAVLRAIIAREGRIDLLKIDTEGTEAELVEAIQPELLDSIREIVYETTVTSALHANRFRASYRLETMRLTQRD